MRRRPLWSVGSILALLGTTVGASASSAGHDRGRPAPVAVLLDLQGSQSSLGRPAMNGFVLGLQEAGADDVLPFVALLDTESDPRATESAARSVAARVRLGAGFTDNDSVLVAGPFFQRVRTPFLAIGATDPSLPDAIGDSVFLTAFGDNTQAAAAAEFARREFGSSVAILWDSTSQYTRKLPRYFRTRHEELGGDVVLDASFDGGCDLSVLGAQVAVLSPPPHFVYLAGLPDCIGEVVASLRSAGVAAPIIGGDGLDTPNLLSSGHGPTSGVWLTTHAWLSDETGTPEAKAFVAAYRQAYGAPPADAFAALGYDAAHLALQTLRHARGKRGVWRALERTRGFAGVTGTISFSPGSHVPSKTVWILRVQDGEKSLAEALVPESVPPPIRED